jgi:hypothetical protein
MDLRKDNISSSNGKQIATTYTAEDIQKLFRSDKKGGSGTEALKPSILKSTFEPFRYSVAIRRRLHGTHTQFCPICGYRGKFRAYGRQPRYNSQCPRCESLERHRLLFLAFQQRELLSGSERVLHFAPESCFEAFIRLSSASYRTADFEPGRAEIVLNIEKIDAPDKTVDL